MTEESGLLNSIDSTNRLINIIIKKTMPKRSRSESKHIKFATNTGESSQSLGLSDIWIRIDSV